jgi:hypothetical protein
MDLGNIRCRGMDWIDVAQDGDQWRALLNTAINRRLPYNAAQLAALGKGSAPRSQLLKGGGESLSAT